ncbi:MAG: CapA family protein [Clostridiales bacterium]|nr:CapA family protein [Clostridiales bacterium]
MNQQPNPPKRKITRAEYEAMLARRKAQQLKMKRRRLLVTLSLAVLVIAFFALIVFACLKFTGVLGFTNPDDVFGSDSEPGQSNTLAATDPSSSVPPTANQNGKVSFIAAGDNLIHPSVFEDAEKRANGNGFNFIDMYAGIADLIKGKDVAYVNQETPMAGESYGYSGWPVFNTPQACGDALVSLGFNTVNIATNHMLDKGANGLKDSIAYWQTKDVTLLGAYTQSDYDAIRTQTVNGITIAWLSYTYGTNDITLDSSSGLVVPYIDEADIIRQTALAKQVGDIVIASMHWGQDSAIQVTNDQKNVAKLLCNNGVDIIIGTHSHTLQPVEWITSQDGTHKTLCYYSLGNMISTMYEYYCMVGGFASFDLVKQGDEVRIENAALIPTMCHYSMDRDGLQIYKLEDYSNDLATKHGSQIQYTGPFTYDTLLKLVTDAVDKSFLPAYYQ